MVTKAHAPSKAKCLRVSSSDQLRIYYLHLIRSADTYLYSIIFCLVKEISCHKIFLFL